MRLCLSLPQEARRGRGCGHTLPRTPPESLGKVGLVGLNYRTAGLSLRGKLGLSPEAALRLMRRGRAAGYAEVVFLGTCNRSELLFVGTGAASPEALLAEESGVEIEELRSHLYHKQGLCAACHLFRLASGLDSAVLGDNEILAQLKKAWKTSEAEGLCGRSVDFLLRHALAAGKRVRTETSIERGVTSVGSLAVREAASMVGGLKPKSVLLLGAGQIAERVMKELGPLKVKRLLVLNRTLTSAARLASRYGGEAAGLSTLEGALAEADVVFATAGGEATVTRALAERIQASRGDRTLTIVDLGVPRTVEQSVGELEFVRLVDLEALTARCASNSERRASAVPQALDILDEELAKFSAAYGEREASPVIHALVEKGEEVRQRNLEWAMAKLSSLDDKERKAVEDLAHRIVRDLLHSPIQELKSTGAEPDRRETVAKIFGLDPGGGPQDR